MKKLKISINLIIVLVLIGVMLIACKTNEPSQQPSGLLGAGNKAAPTPFLEGAVAAYDGEQIIIREVLAPDGETIDEILLWLPSDIKKMDAFVNGEFVERNAVDENYLFSLTEQQSSASVQIEFKTSAEEPTIYCIINLDDIMAPEGNCNW